MNTYADFDLQITRNVPTSTVFVPNGSYSETIKIYNNGPDATPLNHVMYAHLNLLHLDYESYQVIHGNNSLVPTLPSPIFTPVGNSQITFWIWNIPNGDYSLIFIK